MKDKLKEETLDITEKLPDEKTLLLMRQILKKTGASYQEEFEFYRDQKFEDVIKYTECSGFLKKRDKL